MLAGLSTYQVESNGIGSKSESGSQAEDNVEPHGEGVFENESGLKKNG
jgi:hypothetical protein